MRLFWGFMIRGGIFMWPLLLCAVLAVYLICYQMIRFYGLIRADKNSMDLTAVRELLKNQKYDQAKKRLEFDTPRNRILLKGIDYLHLGYDEIAIRDRLEMIYDDRMHDMERMLPLLGVLGEIMPMLGLLGTVSGMIAAFKAIAIFGTANAQAVSSGISEALITTETGLTLAIPALFAHSMFISAVERQAKGMREAASAVVTSLRVVKRRNQK